jgi:hypothetical protein
MCPQPAWIIAWLLVSSVFVFFFGSSQFRFVWLAIDKFTYLVGRVRSLDSNIPPSPNFTN